MWANMTDPSGVRALHSQTCRCMETEREGQPWPRTGITSLQIRGLHDQLCFRQRTWKAPCFAQS